MITTAWKNETSCFCEAESKLIAPAHIIHIFAHQGLLVYGITSCVVLFSLVLQAAKMVCRPSCDFRTRPKVGQQKGWTCGRSLYSADNLRLRTQGAVAGLHMVQCFHEAGLPAGLLSVATGRGAEIGDFLTQHPGVNCISFTGGDTGEEQGLSTDNISSILAVRIRVYVEGSVQISQALVLSRSNHLVLRRNYHFDTNLRECALAVIPC